MKTGCGTHAVTSCVKVETISVGHMQNFNRNATSQTLNNFKGGNPIFRTPLHESTAQ